MGPFRLISCIKILAVRSEVIVGKTRSRSLCQLVLPTQKAGRVTMSSYLINPHFPAPLLKIHHPQGELCSPPHLLSAEFLPSLCIASTKYRRWLWDMRLTPILPVHSSRHQRSLSHQPIVERVQIPATKVGCSSPRSHRHTLTSPTIQAMRVIPSAST